MKRGRERTLAHLGAGAAKPVGASGSAVARASAAAPKRLLTTKTSNSVMQPVGMRATTMAATSAGTPFVLNRAAYFRY